MKKLNLFFTLFFIGAGSYSQTISIEPAENFPCEGQEVSYTVNINWGTSDPIPLSCLTFTWNITPVSGQGNKTATFVWNSAGSKTLDVNVSSGSGVFNNQHEPQPSPGNIPKSNEINFFDSNCDDFSGTADIVVNVGDPGSGNITVSSSSYVICGGDQVTLTANPSGDAIGGWLGLYNSSGTRISTSTTHSVSVAGTYEARARIGTGGCTSIMTRSLTINNSKTYTAEERGSLIGERTVYKGKAVSGTLRLIGASAPIEEWMIKRGSNDWTTYHTTTSKVLTYNDIFDELTQFKALIRKDCPEQADQYTPTVSINVAEFIPDYHSITITSNDNNGEIGKSAKFYSNSGKGLQSQSLNAEENMVLASEPLYDNKDQIVGQTLTAPIGRQSLGFKEGFATINNHIVSEDDWSVDTPSQLDNSDEGTLGNYYSSNNSVESFVAETHYPYSVRNFYEDGTGENKRSTKPDDFLSSGNSGIQKTLPVMDGELRFYNELRSLLIQEAGGAGKVTKKVFIDNNGNESIIYQNDLGQTLATAIGGGEEYTIPVTHQNNDQWFEIHISKNSHLSTTGYEVVNLVTNEVVSSIEPGFYKMKKSSGQINYNPTYTDFSYNFYDNAGKLVASMTPSGTEKLLSLTQAQFDGLNLNLNKLVSEYYTTTYEYDFQGRLLAMNEPDAGRTEYRYRKDGQIRYSQNAEQELVGMYSYTNYDNLGRPIESGECTDCVNFDDAPVDSNLSSNNVTDVIKTYYDAPVSKPSLPSEIANRIGEQEFVHGAVSSSESEAVQSWYSYDDQGRVTWYLQRMKDINKYFLIEYTYDFLGNVLMVAFQPQTEGVSGVVSEAFFHHYAYDANQRLETVHTSLRPPSHPEYTPYLQATYHYYLHGPLKRVELATDLQGIDYTYTAQGWLKSINHPISDIDPGRDGLPPIAGSDQPDHEHFSKDAFGMTLEYYNGDYTSGGLNYNLLRFSTDEFPEQNNGNIRGTVYGSATQGEYVINNNPETLSLDEYRKPVVKAINSIILKPGFDTDGGVFSTILADEPTVQLVEDANDAAAYAYKYDEKYQLIKAKYGETDDIDGSDNAYDVEVANDNGESYDANGNIKGITRYDDYAGTPRDEFQFNYKPNTNQLVSVTHPTDPSKDYIKAMVYNKIGQVVSIDYGDPDQKDIEVEYDVTGKVTRVLEMGTSTPLIQFTYDDRGFRMMKQIGDVQEWYVRDASGQVMAIYHGDDTKPEDGIAQIELPIYGASKLGMAFKNPDHYKYIYELTDHLGSVRAIVTKLSLQATASMEKDDKPNGIDEYEEQFFDNLDVARTQLQSANSYNDPTVPGHSALVNPAKPVGPTTTVRIKEGDEINLEVFVKHGGSFGGTPAGNSLADILGGKVNDGVVGVEGGALTSSLTSLLPGILAAVSGSGNEPKAYLQYVLLDENFAFVSSNEVALGAGTPDVNNWEKFALSTDATQDGYLFAYVINESDENVYFDDFTFSILGTRVIRKTDYYPFGAVAKVWKNNDQAQQEKYRHGYQGEYSEMDTTTGWNAFELRMYDPLIGRWLQVDPMKQHASPYLSMSNNPIRSVDPDGGFDKFKLYADGTMVREANDDLIDTYYYVQVNSEGVEFEQYIGFNVIGNNENGLIRFPSMADGITFYGDSDSFAEGGSYGNGDNYANRDMAAALIGAGFELSRGDNPRVAFGDFSGSDGLSPNSSHTSHKNGLNVDFRYFRLDRKNAPVTVNDLQFDAVRNQVLVDTFKKWGFGTILSYPNNSGTILQNTVEYDGHHNHGHLQGFSPNWRQQ